MWQENFRTWELTVTDASSVDLGGRIRWTDPVDGSEAAWSSAVDLELLYLGRASLHSQRSADCPSLKRPGGSAGKGLPAGCQPVATLSGAKHCVQSPGCQSPRLITVVSEPG